MLSARRVPVVRRAAASSAVTPLALVAPLAGCSHEHASKPVVVGPATPSVAVPHGLTLTRPGAQLKVGQAAHVPWRIHRQPTSVLSVRVVKVVRGSLRRDFKDFTGLTPGLTPYYVTSRIADAGPRPLKPTTTPLYAQDSRKSVFRQTRVRGHFRRCSSHPLPRRFAVHQLVTTCQIFLIRRGATLRALQLRTTREVQPVTWLVHRR